MEKIRLLLYCTKGKPLLYKGITAYTRSVEYVLDKEQYLFGKIETLNGKIVAECDFEVEEIRKYHSDLGEDDDKYSFYETTGKNILWEEELLKYSCLSYDELDNYLKGKKGYAIHIKNLHIFDKPKELKDYSKRLPNGDFQVLGNAPQNMMKCCELKYIIEDYILISIRPEWLCKILNGEKKIEIRKKIIKLMTTDK